MLFFAEIEPASRSVQALHNRKQKNNREKDKRGNREDRKREKTNYNRNLVHLVISWKLLEEIQFILEFEKYKKISSWERLQMLYRHLRQFKRTGTCKRQLCQRTNCKFSTRKSQITFWVITKGVSRTNKNN